MVGEGQTQRLVNFKTWRQLGNLYWSKDECQVQNISKDKESHRNCPLHYITLHYVPLHYIGYSPVLAITVSKVCSGHRQLWAGDNTWWFCDKVDVDQDVGDDDYDDKDDKGNQTRQKFIFPPFSAYLESLVKNRWVSHPLASFPPQLLSMWQPELEIHLD